MINKIQNKLNSRCTLNLQPGAKPYTKRSTQKLSRYFTVYNEKLTKIVRENYCWKISFGVVVFYFHFFFNYGRFSTHVWAWRNCCCWVCHHGCSVTSGFRWLISRCKQPGFACCLGASYVIVSRDYLGDPISLLELRETLRPGEIDTNLHRKTGSRFGSPHIFAVAEPPKISAYSQRPKVASYRIKNIFWSKPR